MPSDCFRGNAASRTVTAARRRARTIPLGYLLSGAGIAMIPWIVALRAQLPQAKVVDGWSTAWAGLDAMEAAALFTTGVLLVRGSDRYRLGAIATATLLVVDAWFDLVTASRSELPAAVAMAAGAEIPLAAALAVMAVVAARQRSGHPVPCTASTDVEMIGSSGPADASAVVPGLQAGARQGVTDGVQDVPGAAEAGASLAVGLAGPAVAGVSVQL